MKDFPLKKPEPDFEKFRRVIMGDARADRVHLAELMLDFEIMQDIYEKYFGKKWLSLAEAYKPQDVLKMLSAGKGIQPLTMDGEKRFWRQHAEIYHGLGYDYVPEMSAVGYILFMAMPKVRMADDTAGLSRGKRIWVEEGKGIITTWEQFEKYNWGMFKLDLGGWIEFWNRNTPPGMKISVMGMLYEQLLERLMGYEGLFLGLHEQPDLVEAIFDKWGRIMYDIYEQAVECEAVGMIFHGDDMGYKTGTMIHPEHLRKYLFPWLKKYAELAHSHGKMFWLHSCGNLREIMEDLIEDVKIDAFHSFQEEIMPISDFMKKYGDRVGALGGVDVDNLARMEEEPLRAYCRKILDECVPGRFAFGSGNSVTNYIPVENYLIMLDEGRKYS